MTHDLFSLLCRSALVACCALMVVLVLRVPVRRRLGAQFAYRLWLILPVAILAMLLPAPARPLFADVQLLQSAISVTAPVALPATPAVAPFDAQPWLLGAWLAGALAALAGFVRQQRRYIRNLGLLAAGEDGALRAQTSTGCPALVGAVRPRIVLPNDFESRYTPRERELVLAHEHAHLARGDAQINALAALLRCLNWFNPLFHFAAPYFRFDQELACDALVIARFPEARRSYADAMLKAQLVGEARQELRLPAGCYWPPSHPLKERIAMLKFPVLSRRQRPFASAAIFALALSVGYASWAAQPSRIPASNAAYDGEMKVDLRLSVDGRKIDGSWTSRTNGTGCMYHDGSSDFWTICTLPGKAFTLAVTRNTERWELEAVTTPLVDGTIEFATTIKHDDAVVSRGLIKAHVGEPASLQAGENAADGGFKGFKLDLVLTRVVPPLASQSSLRQTSQSTADQSKPSIKLGELQNVAPSENITYRSMKPPKYPADAVKAGMGAQVILKVFIDEHGLAKSAEIEKLDLIGDPKPIPPDGTIHDKAEFKDGFANASIAAAMSWKYNPGVKDGKPFAGYALVPIDFSVHDCSKQDPCPPPAKAAPPSPSSKSADHA